MTTEKMIEELYKVAEQHKKDVVGVGELNIHAMCTDVANRLNELIEKQPKVGEWIPCSVRMPEEHDSVFAKAKGTDKWNDAMFVKISDDVNVTIEYDDGTRTTRTSHTLDGKWKAEQEFKFYKPKVIAWMPLPEPYKGVD